METYQIPIVKSESDATGRLDGPRQEVLMLLHGEYVYKNFGFMPKWLNIRAY